MNLQSSDSRIRQLVALLSVLPPDLRADLKPRICSLIDRDLEHLRASHARPASSVFDDDDFWLAHEALFSEPSSTPAVDFNDYVYLSEVLGFYD